MSERFQNPLTNRSLRARIGGRWAISLPPYLWSTPVVVGLLPIASSNEYSTLAGLLRIIVIAALAWLVFGLVLYIGHLTYFRNRATNPVSPIATVLLAVIGGVAQSFVHGDWFQVFGLYGFHSYSKVINAGIGSIAWVTISASFMYSKYSFIETRDKLLSEQQRLLQDSDEWLQEVRKHRNDLATQMRDKLQNDWELIRADIRHKLESRPLEWRTVLADLSLTSQVTALTLTESLRRTQTPKSSIQDAFRLIASIPLMKIRGVIILLATVGVLPLTRIAGFTNALIMIGVIAALLVAITAIGRRAIRRWPRHGIEVFTITSFLILLAPLSTISILINQGVETYTSFALTLAGGITLSATFVVQNFSELNQRMRANQLQSLQSQVLLLNSIEEMNQKINFEARADLAGFLNVTINGAIRQATEAIEGGLATADVSAVNSGLAVIDAVYSNILGRYTSEEHIDFRHELEALAQPWSKQAIITWSVSAEALDREVSRRVLLVIAQCISHLVPSNLATRLHIDVNGEISKAELIVEINADKAWIDDAPLTRDVLDASTSTNWFISGDHTHSKLQATIG